MICYLTQTLADSSYEKLPIFLQYVKPVQASEKYLALRSHGNSTKSNVPFTSILPSVLETIRVCLLTVTERLICLFSPMRNMKL